MTDCECDHPSSAHVLGGPCELCPCKEFVPADWEDEESDVNDFGDPDPGHITSHHMGWNDHPLSDGPGEEDSSWLDDEDGGMDAD